MESQKRSTMVLTLCHSHLPSARVNTHTKAESWTRAQSPILLSFFFFLVYRPHPEDLLPGHSSNCAYKVKDCCQYLCIIRTYGTHSHVKYTWPHEIYMAAACTVVAHMIRRPSRNSRVWCWKMLAAVSVQPPTHFNEVFQKIQLAFRHVMALHFLSTAEGSF